MAITRDASQDTNNATSSGTSVVLTFPATMTVNKTILAMLWSFSGKATLGTPSGYTKIQDIEHSSQTFSCALFGKVSAGNETAVTLTQSGSATAMRGFASQYSGALTVTPWDKVANNQNGASGAQTLP